MDMDMDMNTDTDTDTDTALANFYYISIHTYPIIHPILELY